MGTGWALRHRGTEIPQLRAPRGKKVGLKGKESVFYRHCNLGPRSKSLLQVLLCPASKPPGGPKGKEQACLQYMNVRERDMVCADTQSKPPFIFVSFLPQRSSDLSVMLFS